MLGEKQLAVLGADEDKHLLYLAGIDKATWAEYSVGEGYGWVMYLLGRLATALLARQRDRLDLVAIVEQLEGCEYECIAGPLRLNTAFIKLKEMADETN